MPSLNFFNVFTTDLTAAKHDFSSHTYKIMLTNSAPVATNAVKADITDIAAQNGYTAGGNACTITRGSSGTQETISGAEVAFTASGGSFGPFRYAVLYNDSQATPAKPLVAWWDYGSSISLNNGESIKLDPNSANPGTLFTVG